MQSQKFWNFLYHLKNKPMSIEEQMERTTKEMHEGNPNPKKTWMYSAWEAGYYRGAMRNYLYEIEDYKQQIEKLKSEVLKIYCAKNTNPLMIKIFLTIGGNIWKLLGMNCVIVYPH
jgi:hypothetical protein